MSWDDLPHDIQEIIFGITPVQDVLSCRLASRSLQLFIDSLTLWKRILIRNEVDVSFAGSNDTPVNMKNAFIEFRSYTLTNRFYYQLWFFFTFRLHSLPSLTILILVFMLRTFRLIPSTWQLHNGKSRQPFSGDWIFTKMKHVLKHEFGVVRPEPKLVMRTSTYAGTRKPAYQGTAERSTFEVDGQGLCLRLPILIANYVGTEKHYFKLVIIVRPLDRLRTLKFIGENVTGKNREIYCKLVNDGEIMQFEYIHGTTRCHGGFFYHPGSYDSSFWDTCLAAVLPSLPVKVVTLTMGLVFAQT